MSVYSINLQLQVVKYLIGSLVEHKPAVSHCPHHFLIHPSVSPFYDDHVRHDEPLHTGYPHHTCPFVVWQSLVMRTRTSHETSGASRTGMCVHAFLFKLSAAV